MRDLVENLSLRAKLSLDNPAEITPQLLAIASNQSNEICKGKIVPDFARIDIAYIRLKIYLKIELNGEDELLLKNALECVKNAPFITDNGEAQSSRFYIAKKRESEFC